MRSNFTNFHEFASEIVSFQIRSAPQFHQFSSKIAHFQIRNFVRNGQISNKERGVPGRVGPGRVADSLFRPHPEQRARASREPQSPPSREQTVEKLHGVGLCTTTGRFGGCGAQPLHRSGSRTRQIGRTAASGQFFNKECASISQIFTKFRRKCLVFK